MEETKYHLLLVKKLFLIPVAIFWLIAVVLLILGLAIGAIIAFVFLATILFIIGLVVGLILRSQSRFYYFQLSKDTLIYNYNMIGKGIKIDYKDIRSITFSNERIKSIDAKAITSWPFNKMNSQLPMLFYSKIENPQQFIEELKRKYKIATGKNLTITS